MPRTDTQPLEAVLAEAMQAGAVAAEALLHTQQGLRLSTSGRRPTTREVRTERLTVRVWRSGGHQGEATGSPSQTAKLIRQALAATKKSPAVPGAGPIGRLAAPAQGLDIDDRRYPALTVADRSDVLSEAFEDAASRHPAVRPGTFWWQDTLEHRTFLNTAGVERFSQSTRYGMGGDATLHRDRDLTLYDEVGGRSFASTACLPFGTRLAQQLVDLSQETHVPDGPVRLLLRPRAAAPLLAWLADQIAIESTAPGTTVLSDLTPIHAALHLLDDGTRPGGWRTYAFDDRGVPPVPLPLLRDGAATGRLVGAATATSRGDRPTGHEWAGENGKLRAANVSLNGGVRSIHARLGELNSRTFSLNHLPFDLGIDPRTGHIDLPVHGVLFDVQEPVGARCHVRLVGNVLEALRQIVTTASDTDRTLHVDAPGIVIDGLSLAAE